MRIYIARHGQVLPPKASAMTADGAQLYMGDPALTELGEIQAAALGRYLCGLGFQGLVLASPYRRTLSTAQHCAAAAGLEVLCCAEVREMVGAAGIAPDFAGLTIDEAREVCPLLRSDAALPWPWWTTEVETKEDVLQRVDAAVQRYRALGQDLLFITHGGPMNAATKAWLRRSGADIPQWLDCWNTQLNRFSCDDQGRWHCEALADTAHLSGPQQHCCNELDYDAMQAMRTRSLGSPAP